MFKQNHKHYLRAAALFVLVSVMALWSWNTISELWGLPHAQYKHVVAAFILLLTIRWSIRPIGGIMQKGSA